MIFLAVYLDLGLSCMRKKYIVRCIIDYMATETVTLPRAEYQQMIIELETLRRTDLYKRLLQFIGNIQTKKFSRSDLGF